MFSDKFLGSHQGRCRDMTICHTECPGMCPMQPLKCAEFCYMDFKKHWNLEPTKSSSLSTVSHNSDSPICWTLRRMKWKRPDRCAFGLARTLHKSQCEGTNPGMLLYQHIFRWGWVMWFGKWCCHCYCLFFGKWKTNKRFGGSFFVFFHDNISSTDV